MNIIKKKTDLNINTLLINWSLICGNLHDGIIEPTKFGRFNEWATFFLTFFTGIKWGILMFYPKGTEMANLLGDWGYFFGPKVIISFMLALDACYVITTKILFLFTSKQPKKMFYWLDALQYDNDNQSFIKLKLNETESKKFIKRLSLTVFLLKCFTPALICFFVVVNFVLFFKKQNSHHLNYLISLITFLPQMYFYIQFIFGFLVLLYPVSLLNIKLQFSKFNLFNYDLIIDLFLL